MLLPSSSLNRTFEIFATLRSIPFDFTALARQDGLDQSQTASFKAMSMTIG